MSRNPVSCRIHFPPDPAPTELPCLGVPGEGEPGLVQGRAEHAEQDRDLVSSNCSNPRALQKVPEHGQQLCRGRSRERMGKVKLQNPPLGFSSLMQLLSNSEVSTDGHLSKGRFSPVSQVVPAFHKDI